MEMAQPNTGANIQQGMAIYRKPQATSPEFCIGHWKSGGVPRLEEKSTFCIHPFHAKSPLSWLDSETSGAGWQSCEQVWLDANREGNVAIPEGLGTPSTSRDQFFAEVLGIQNAIAVGELQKAVAARALTEEKPMAASGLWRSFCELHQAYPNAFLFLVIHPLWGCWMGATPETLLQVNNHEGKVMSLAGTLTKDQAGWTDKEALEQSVTSRFICEVLAEEGISGATETAVGELQMGDVRHLMSEWRFDLPTNQTTMGEGHSVDEQFQKQIGSLIDRLHPTPAVGGYPKQLALDWLSKNENLDRSLYTGFVGMLGPKEVELFVTLRCVQLFSGGFTLYAGCGVNAGSDPDIEWDETTAKMELLRRFL